MAITTPMPGRKYRISAATTVGGSYSLLGYGTAVNKTAQVNTTSTETFENANAYTDTGANQVTYEVEALAIPDDAGQAIVRAAKAAGNSFFIKVLPMGGDASSALNTVGFTHEVKASSTGHNAAAGGSPQTWRCTLVSVADEVVLAASGSFIL